MAFTAVAPEAGERVPLRAALSWFDAHYGPARDLASFRLMAPEPPWWVSMCMLARAPVGSWHVDFPAGAAGTSTDPSEALDRMLGELIERYSALNAEFEGHAVLPDRSPLLPAFPRCGPDEQCPPAFRGDFDGATAITHAPMQRLSDGGKVLVPAGWAHLGFSPQPPEPLVTLPISTGLAFHPSLVVALWSGLCEVVERDAMMLTWWLRRPAAEVDCTGVGLPEPLADRLQRVASVGLTAQFFDITSDFRVPTVFCVLRGPYYPRCVVGAACRSDPLAACTKALDEAVSARVSLKGREAFAAPSSETFEWVQALDHHSLFYAAAGPTDAFEFLLDAGLPHVSFARFAGQVWWSRPKDLAALSLLAQALEPAGLTILWTDVTAPEAMPMGHVVKVVIPEMLPLSQSHQARWLATPRLLSAGGYDGPMPSEAFNPYPHPFA